MATFTMGSLAAVTGLILGTVVTVHHHRESIEAERQPLVVPVDITDRHLTPTATLVREGLIDFEVTNHGSQTHDFVIFRTNLGAADLTVTDDERVNEESDGVQKTFEGGDIEPGATKTFHAALTEGSYVIVSNLPGQYRAGVRTLFLVTQTRVEAASLNTQTADFAITADRVTAPAGIVDLQIHNAGPSPHEFILFKTDLKASELPLDENGRVNEEGEGLTNVFDTGDNIDAGDSKHFDVALTAGSYLMVCNLPAHFGKGMHTALTITDNTPAV